MNKDSVDTRHYLHIIEIINLNIVLLNPAEHEIGKRFELFMNKDKKA